MALFIVMKVLLNATVPRNKCNVHTRNRSIITDKVLLAYALVTTDFVLSLSQWKELGPLLPHLVV